MKTKTVQMQNSEQQELIDRMVRDRKLRTEITRSSHYWFFHTYFSEYVRYPTAPFQREMFQITEDPDMRLAVITAFRGSAKSTIMTLSYPIWAILGSQRKKYVVIISQTQQQAKLHLTNLKREMESNELLRADLGPFEERDEEWSSGSLVLPQYGARITAISTEQSIRGLRHGAYRPDLIICDDVEDLASTRTREGRNRTHQWLTGDVVPAGDRGTKVIVVGNLLHEDSLLMRLHEDIEKGKLDGISRAYPLLDERGKPLWSGKFALQSDIAALKRTIGDDAAWHREYLLTIISDAERVIHPEWIQYYDVLPSKDEGRYRYRATGIDLAISEKDTADYTAMVSAQVHGGQNNLRVYILPNPVNKRMDFPATVATAENVSRAVGGGTPTRLFIEEVGYQAALIQALSRSGIPTSGMKVHGQDKRARLSLTTHLIQQGKVLFPRKGAEALIAQLVGFGVEKHDDLADAFALLILKIMEQDKPPPGIIVLGLPRPRSPFLDDRGWRTIRSWSDLRGY